MQARAVNDEVNLLSFVMTGRLESLHKSERNLADKVIEDLSYLLRAEIHLIELMLCVNKFYA